jgi:2-polyprenyl-3-methyl-5-hydroxy-6-metoxy-1,4-benzoquinol methylase
VMASVRILNKTMDIEDLKSDRAKVVIEELNTLIKDMHKRRLTISSWVGLSDWTREEKTWERMNRGYGYAPLEGAANDDSFPWFLYWEIVWLVLNNEFDKHHRVLDLGGSSSLFSYYLASKGLDVTTIDLKESLVDNANFVAQRMGWDLRNYVKDMTGELQFDSPFDHITSVCVYEHIPMYERVEINRRIKQLLVEGGKFSITFDYRNPSPLARIDSPSDIHDQFIEPSGLVVRGNKQFVDTGENYLLNPFYHKDVAWKSKVGGVLRGHFRPQELLKTKHTNDYTFGALFLEKREMT